MIPFRTHQGLTGIAAEVGFEKLRGLRQRYMHLMHCTSANNNIPGLTLENMAASLSIIRKKMKVISRDAERAGKAGRPKADQRALPLLEKEFLLRGCRRFQSGSFWYRLHNSRLDQRKHSIDAKRIEQVLRIS